MSVSPPKVPLKRVYGTAPHEKPFIEIGSEVTCPNPYCKRHIARFVKTLYAGQMLTSAHLLGESISKGGETKCHRCGIAWFLKETSQIHLSTGWIPQY